MSSKKILPCVSCNRVFNKKYQLDRHLSSGCEDISNVSSDICIIKELDDIKCRYCNTLFIKKSKLDRHLLSTRGDCYKIRSNNIKNINRDLVINNVTQNITNNIQQQNINNIQQQNITNNIQQQNITNNIQQLNNYQNITIQPIINNTNITIARHGEETISHITKEVMLEILDIESFPKMCTELMRLLYFNKEVPENRNWTIVYPKNKNAGVEFNHKTNKFERKSTYDIIDDKFSNMVNLLFELVQEISNDDNEKNNLSKRQKININKYGMHFGQLDISKTSKDVYKSIHEMAFNSRKSQMEVWRESGHEGNHLSLKF
jgi:hypothetical protein